MAEAQRILRLDEVVKATGLKAPTVYRAAREGRFPKPLKLLPGGRASGWLAAEVAEFIEQRAAGRTEGQAA